MTGYKKLYEETFEKLQNIVYNHKKQGHIIVPIEDIEKEFPKLKESEDCRLEKQYKKPSWKLKSYAKKLNLLHKK